MVFPVRIIVFISSLSFCDAATLVEDDPSGFVDFFHTNLHEFNDKPITFSYPVPRWLKGALIRNGGAMYEIGQRSFTNVFDGFGKLHSFTFYGNGTVSMSARFLQTEYYKQSLATNTIAPYFQFGKLVPPYNEIEKMESIKNNMENLNVNVYRVRNSKTGQYEYMSVNDVWNVYQIEEETLQTLKLIAPPMKSSSHVYIPGFSSAHPIKEFGKETYLTYQMSVSIVPYMKSIITLYRMTSVGDREEIVTWDIEAQTYMHSFSVTKNYVIFIGQPVSINIMKVAEYGDIQDAMEYRYNDSTFIYVVDLRTNKVTTVKYDTFVSYFHQINAYEENNKIIVDICTQNSSNMFSMDLNYIRSVTLRNNITIYSGIKRFTIDLNTKSVSAESFEPSKNNSFANNLDMPSINENFRHVKYCYAYGLVIKADNKHFNKWALVKKDVCRVDGDLSWAIDNHYPSEAWFEPTPNSTREDDGVLMTHVFDGIKKESYLVLINATTMQTLSKGILPTTMPFSFHGRFFQNDSI
ncbi:beta,beta-carotene 15,15'-dioxygenase-like [Mytilus trossulus]|uniref:beta,beta-carotene 15,15'-dioxygenase-like n=1 Tax=Mytilus trossulus TaxID=6551 RepID=UPI003004CAE9